MADADQLDQTLTAANATAATLVVFDCGGLKFLASLSLGTLMHFQSQVRRTGGRVCFAGVQPQVKTMLQRAHLTQICELHETVEAALLQR
jgi:anti-anti-sigma factor